MFIKDSEDFAHGLNERIRVDAFYDALTYWSVLIKTLAGGPSIDSVHGVDPVDFLDPLGCLDAEIDHHRLVVAAYQDALERRVAQRIDFLVRHVGRHENEIAGVGLGDELEPRRPSACAPRRAPRR